MRYLIFDKYRVSAPICAFLFVIRHFHQVCVFIKNTINSLFDCIRSQRVDIAVYPLQFQIHCNLSRIVNMFSCQFHFNGQQIFKNFLLSWKDAAAKFFSNFKFDTRTTLRVKICPDICFLTCSCYRTMISALHIYSISFRQLFWLSNWS